MLQSHEVEGTASLPGRQPLTARNESAKPVSKNRMMDSCFEPSLINFFLSFLVDTQVNASASICCSRKYHCDRIKLKICPGRYIAADHKGTGTIPSFFSRTARQDKTQLATSKG